MGMATAAASQSLRLCLRSSRRAGLRPVLQAPASQRVRQASSGAGKPGARDRGKPIPVYETPGDALEGLLRSGELKDASEEEIAEARRLWSQTPAPEKENLRRTLQQAREGVSPLTAPVRVLPSSFWNAHEDDADLITNDAGDDQFEEDDITSIGHAQLEEHRDRREYARITIWEMPLLAKFAKPFEPPAKDEVLRFRYTSYMGEFHPAEKKVVVEFSPYDLDELSDAQKRKLAKLVGPRFHPETGIVRMSCEMFEQQAQNKRYLGDLIEKLIAEAKNPADMFEDIPLDTRHYKPKQKPKFPKEWRLTEERRRELEAIRRRAFELDQAKKAEGTLVDGVQRIRHALAGPAPEVKEKVAELLTAPSAGRAAQPLRRR